MERRLSIHDGRATLSAAGAPEGVEPPRWTSGGGAQPVRFLALDDGRTLFLSAHDAERIRPKLLAKILKDAGVSVEVRHWIYSNTITLTSRPS